MNTAFPAIGAIKSPADLLDLPPQWLGTTWPDLIFAISAGIVMYLALEAVRTLGIAFCKRLSDTHRGGLFAVLRHVVGKTSHLYMIIASARLVAAYTEPPAHALATVGFLFIVGSVLQVARWFRAFLFSYIELRSDPATGGNEALANASGLIRALVNSALIVVALVVILDNLGVNVTGLVAGLGIGGIAIGLAAQGIFSDLFASLSIILDRPFRVGETIDFGNGPGTVEKIGLKSTRLRAITGEKMIVSNAQLLNKDIMSYASLDRRRFTFPIGLIYQTSPEDAAKVPGLLQEIVEAQGARFVRSGFTGFGASSLDFEVIFEVLETDYEVIYGIRHRIGLALLKRFNELGLSFAYPTQTTFTADPDGRMIMPYPSSWPVTEK